MSSKSAPAEPAPDFETALRELEALVEDLERGDVSLEESLRLFERGVLLARHCQSALREAEAKIQILTEKDGEPVLEQFEPESD